MIPENCANVLIDAGLLAPPEQTTIVGVEILWIRIISLE